MMGSREGKSAMSPPSATTRVRLRYVKDPDTGKRVSRPNPPSEKVTTAVPELRIVDDELWNQVRARQLEMRRVAPNGDPKQFNQARRPKYLFSGLTKCAECGGGYVMYWREHLACFGARSHGTCTNRLTISRQEVEERILVALRDKLMRRDLFEDFCREYARELNRLRMEHRASLSHGRQELAAVEREIRKFIQAIKDGVSALSIKDELLTLEARKAELQSRLEAPEMPELLHPRMSDVYREKVGSLCLALESEESRTGAREAIRALVEAIVAVEYAVGDDDGVATSLLEQSVALDVERVRFGVPDDLVHSHLVASRIRARKVALQGNQKDVLAVDGGGINGRIEGDREACLEGEAVQSINDIEVVAVRDQYVAIGIRHVHPLSGVLVCVRDREHVARKRAVRIRQIEARYNTRRGVIAVLTS